MASAPEAPIPSEVKLHRVSKTLELAYDESGKRYVLPCEYLRVYSPSAEVRGHAPGQEVLQHGCREVGIERVEPVGNYAVRLVFSDGHDTGLYTWEFLYHLACHQDELWLDYLQRLDSAGLSRDPVADSAPIELERWRHSFFRTSLPCPARLLAGFDRLQKAHLLLLQRLDLTTPMGGFLAGLGSFLARLVALGLRGSEAFGGAESLLGGGLALLLLGLTEVSQFCSRLGSILMREVKFGPQVGGAAFDLDGTLLGNGRPVLGDQCGLPRFLDVLHEFGASLLLVLALGGQFVDSAIGGLQFDPLGVVGVAKLLVDGVGLGAFGLPAGLRGAQ